MFFDEVTKEKYKKLVEGIGNIQLRSGLDNVRLSDLEKNREYELKGPGEFKVSGTRDILYHAMIDLMTFCNCTSCDLSGLFQLNPAA